MDHVAIMNKSWGLLPKILSGQKTIESRWYRAKYAPWDRISEGDTVFFKNAGEPLTLKAGVQSVLQFADLTQEKVNKILTKYARYDGIEKKDIAWYYSQFMNKKYCLLIFLQNPEKIEPLLINKKGFGSMAAWLTVQSISNIKL